MHKIRQSGDILDRRLVQLLKTGLLSMKDVAKPSVKNVLMELESTTPAPATDTAIPINIFGSGMTKLKFSNEEMKDIMKKAK